MKQYDIDTLHDYEERGLLKSRRHPDLPLTVWNYTPEVQYGRLWDDLTRACRGLVLDDEGRTVSPCIPKFFNLGETERTIDEAVAAEAKYDGSLIHLFWYEDAQQWIVASRGSFESEQAEWAREMVYDHPRFDGSAPDARYPASTYVCELIHPENRIVVDYGGETSLRLLATFVNGHEHPANLYADMWPWPIAQRVPMTSLNAYLDQSNIEGVVLHMQDGERIKVKTDEYVEYHRIVTGLTAAKVVEHFLEHRDIDEILSVAPDEWHDDIRGVFNEYLFTVQEIVFDAHDEHDEIVSALGKGFTRKDFAMRAKDSPRSRYLFALLDDREIWEMAEEHVSRNLTDYGIRLTKAEQWN